MLKFEVTPLASLWFHGEPQGCVKTVHLHSLAYEVVTALKFCRNVIKHSGSCRPQALGSMISAEATREGGRSKLRTCFSQNPYGKKVTKYFSELGCHRLCRVPHEELLRKLWFDVQGLYSGFPTGVQCSKMVR